MRSLCGLYFYKSVQFIYLYFLCLICLYCPLHCPSITPSGKRSAQIQSHHTDFESQSHSQKYRCPPVFTLWWWLWWIHILAPSSHINFKAHTEVRVWTRLRALTRLCCKCQLYVQAWCETRALQILIYYECQHNDSINWMYQWAQPCDVIKLFCAGNTF